MNLEELLRVPTGQHVAADTETTGLFPDAKCACGCGGHVHVTMVGVAGDDFSGVFPFAAQGVENLPAHAWDALLRWLGLQNIEMHNAKFDLHQFDRGAPTGMQGVDLSDAAEWDTMNAAWVLWPLEDKSLKPTYRRLHGKDSTPEESAKDGFLMKLPRGQNKDYWRVPFPIQGPYCEADAKMTHVLREDEIAAAQKPDFAGDDLNPFIDREFKVMKVLFKMEQRGIGFDVKLAEQRGAKYAARQQAIESVLPFKPTRAEALKYWEKQSIDLDPLKLERTATGRFSLDSNGMRKAVGFELPGAQMLQEYLALDFALGRWYGPEGWASKIGPDGRARTDYKQDGAVTMRFSSKNLAFQQIPQAQTIDKYVESVFDLFVPKPGHVLVDFDLSNAELRVAASYAQCKPMIEHFLAGTNIHDDTTRNAFGLDPSHARWDDYRRDAKILTFAMLYGAGEDGLYDAMNNQGRVDDGVHWVNHQGSWGLTVDQIVGFLTSFHSMYPEFDVITRSAANKAKSRGYVRLISGRKRVFQLKNVYNEEWKRWIPRDNTWSAFNSVVQGGVAEFLKTMMLHVEENHPGMLLLQTHDSLTMEIPIPQLGPVTTSIVTWAEEAATKAFRIPMKLEVKKWKTLQPTA